MNMRVHCWLVSDWLKAFSGGRFVKRFALKGFETNISPRVRVVETLLRVNWVFASGRLKGRNRTIKLNVFTVYITGVRPERRDVTIVPHKQINISLSLTNRE